MTMPRISFLPFALTATILVLAPNAQAQTSSQPEGPKAHTPGVQFQLSPTKTALVFEPNHGQAASNFQWIGRGAGFRLGITADGATLEFRDKAVTTPKKPLFPNASQVMKSRTAQKSALQSTLVKFHLLRSNGWKSIGAKPTGGTSNYFIGKDPAS